MPQMHLKYYKQQRLFLTAATRGIIWIAGIGSGKSLTLTRLAIIKALRGRRTCIISFAYQQLRDTVLWNLKRELPKFGLEINKHYTLNLTTLTLEFLTTGGQILLRSADDPDSLRGLSVDDIGIDECRNFKTREVYDIALGRIRESDDAQWYLVTTPKGRKHWTYQLLVQLGIDPKGSYAENSGVTFIRSSMVDSPFLPKSYIEETVRLYSAKVGSQEINAEFVDMSEGVIESVRFERAEYIKPIHGVRAWDFAFSTKESADFVAGALISHSGSKILINDMIKRKIEWPDLRELIISTAISDGTGIKVVLEEQGQQIAFSQDLKREPRLRPYTLEALRLPGSKLAKAMPWISRLNLGEFAVCSAAWNGDFLDECDSFSADDSHAHDDQIDSVSLGYASLFKPKAYMGHRSLY